MVYHINKDGSRSRIFSSLYYKTGMDDTLRENIDDQVVRVRKGKASFILVDGELGSGKTNTGITIARHVQPDFNMVNQVGRGTEQFIKALEYTRNHEPTFMCVGKAEPIKACVFDEAHTFNKKRTMSKMNQDINTIFNVCRHEKIIIILVLPHFSELDNGIYNTGAVRGLVHMRDMYKDYSDVLNYDGIAIENMLDYIDRWKTKVGKRKINRDCYKKARRSFGHVRLNKEYYKSIAVSSNIGKNDLIKQSMSSISSL